MNRMGQKLQKSTKSIKYIRHHLKNYIIELSIAIRAILKPPKNSSINFSNHSKIISITNGPKKSSLSLCLTSSKALISCGLKIHKSSINCSWAVKTRKTKKRNISNIFTEKLSNTIRTILKSVRSRRSGL